LVKFNPGMNSQDSDGNTALHIAIEKGFSYVALCLINKHRAEWSWSCFCKIDSNEFKNEAGENPLYLALKHKFY